MNIQGIAYIVTDLPGNTQTAICGDCSDYIVVGGYDENGDYRLFESEAYHLESWVEKLGFSLRTHSFTIDTDAES